MTPVSAAVEAQVRAVPRRCRGPLAPVVRALVRQLLAAGTEAGRREARSLDRENRGGCGADFNAIILANPLDGQVHDYVCPKCGTAGIYKAPRVLEV